MRNPYTCINKLMKKSRFIHSFSAFIVLVAFFPFHQIYLRWYSILEGTYRSAHSRISLYCCITATRFGISQNISSSYLWSCIKFLISSALKFFRLCCASFREKMQEAVLKSINVLPCFIKTCTSSDVENILWMHRKHFPVLIEFRSSVKRFALISIIKYLFIFALESASFWWMQILCFFNRSPLESRS